MKRAITLAIAAISATLSLHAQDDALQKAMEAAAAALQEAPAAKSAEDKPQYWNSWTQFDLGTSNTSLWNWAAGGYNTLTLSIGADANANYSKELVSWTNRLQLQYGTTRHHSTSAPSSRTVMTPTSRTSRAANGTGR